MRQGNGNQMSKLFAAALGKSLVVMDGAEHQHALKEVDAAALAVVESPNQVVEILNYVGNFWKKIE